MDENKHNINLVIKNNPDSDDFEYGTYTLEFKNCSFRVEGDYFLIENEEKNTKTGQVFQLKTIKSYKIWQ
jgi:hypothetical protein